MKPFTSVLSLFATLASLVAGNGTPSGGSGCALIVSGPPPRTSAFDGASHAFGGSRPPHNPESTCITYDAVSAAFDQAKYQERLQRVKGKFSNEQVGALSMVIEETTRILAQQYSLSRDAVANGLPLIDTTKTSIEDYCPDFLMTPKCEVERYRSQEGLCNNLNMPHWGAAMHGHDRVLTPDFADGINAPRISITGQPLPSARVVSQAVHNGEERHDHAVTLLLVIWGQYIDHDITLTAEVKDHRTGKAPKCCDGDQHRKCLPIEVPHNDRFYSKYRQRCINFVRTHSGLSFNCRLGPKTSHNLITSFLDGSTSYANTDERLKLLRTYQGGKLKMLDIFAKFGMKPLLPLNLENPDEGCIRPSKDIYCFLAGDGRVNEQTVLAMIHTIFAREHNRIADELSKVNPHWSDETLFQEAKHICGALIQQITYNEFLPMVLGRDVMEKHNLMLLKDGYVKGYDDTVNPSVSAGFTAAAFRFGHSLLPSEIERWSNTHRYIGSQKLSGMLLQPYDLYKEGWADSYVLGLTNQVAQALDDTVTKEVTNHLFEEPGKRFGMDLAAINIQRGRELGVPSYTRYREWCGLPPVRTFDDLIGYMRNETVYGYKQTYSSPDDIDLWSAGISELPLPGSMVGPTFACIIGKQFHNLRFGDRFWYENGGWPSSFTLEQLNEIRKVKLSRLICDNSDSIDSVQVYAMVLPDHEINPRVPCKSGVLKSIDFSKWRDANYHQTPGFFQPPPPPASRPHSPPSVSRPPPPPPAVRRPLPPSPPRAPYTFRG